MKKFTDYMANCLEMNMKDAEVATPETHKRRETVGSGKKWGIYTLYDYYSMNMDFNIKDTCVLYLIKQGAPVKRVQFSTLKENGEKIGKEEFIKQLKVLFKGTTLLDKVMNFDI